MCNRTAAISRVQVGQSPYLDMFFRQTAVQLTLDSGATSNMMSKTTAQFIGAEIKQTTQSAHQADGSSLLSMIGEFMFDGLVMAALDVDILAGIPFMEINDIAIRPSKRQIVIGGNTTYGCGSESASTITACRVHVLRAPAQPTTVWPGEYIEFEVHEDLAGTELALEPRCNVKDTVHIRDNWPSPCLVSSVSRIV